jgi:hypothetical protein
LERFSLFDGATRGVRNEHGDGKLHNPKRKRKDSVSCPRWDLRQRPLNLEIVARFWAGLASSLATASVFL